MKHLLRTSLSFILDTDPASRTKWGVIFTYPGFQILVFYKVAHALWRSKWHGLASFIMFLGRWITGVEIHPGATIKGPLFIDHGMGAVIGETAIIGSHVVMYHNVTLGGITGDKDKRHPTIGDHVIIGAGACILGDITIGNHAKVGANAVVIKDVSEKDTVVGVPARSVSCKKSVQFMPYGMPNPKDCPDLQSQIDELRELLNKNS